MNPTNRKRAENPIHTDITGESHVQPVPLPEAGSVRVYTVREGDSWSSIAEKVYGDAGQWKRIRHANGDRIEEQDRLQIGSRIRIPVD